MYSVRFGVVYKMFSIAVRQRQNYNCSASKIERPSKHKSCLALAVSAT